MRQAQALADVVKRLEAWADQLDKTPWPVEAQYVRACALLVRDALALPAYAPQGSQDEQTNARVIANLAMLVRRLAHKHPNEKLKKQANDYLLGEGLEGSVLRSYTPAAPAAESSDYPKHWPREVRDAWDRAIEKAAEEIDRELRWRTTEVDDTGRSLAPGFMRPLDELARIIRALRGKYEEPKVPA